jgi:hypothetical protein
MTFTVTPQPPVNPADKPRVRIDIDSDDPAKPFTALTIYRDGKKLREQPFVGSSATVLYDYEAPFGVPVTYSAEGLTPASPTTVFATSWPNLTGWTTEAGSPSVSGGMLRGSAASLDRVARTVATPASGKVVLDTPMLPSSMLALGNVTLTASQSAGLPIRYVTFGGTTMNFAHSSGPLTFQWGPDGSTIITADGTWSTSATLTLLSGRVAASANVDGRVPGFTMADLGTLVPFTASSSATLDVTETWLIHPSQPSLSMMIDGGPDADPWNDVYIDSATASRKTSATKRAVHEIEGAELDIVITNGPRAADEWNMVVSAATIAQKNGLRALTRDESPLLLRSPPASGLDLPDGFYSVGNVDVDRLANPTVSQRTNTTLPLKPVGEPIVRVGALWTAGDVLTNYATGQDVLDDFDTSLDLLAGPSS